MKEDKSISIEEGFLKLTDILENMDSQNVSLEESFKLYNEGVLLVKELSEKLDDVEAKLKVIND
jgi:exodeoxyribonuclease VII small subunit